MQSWLKIATYFLSFFRGILTNWVSEEKSLTWLRYFCWTVASKIIISWIGTQTEIVVRSWLAETEVSFSLQFPSLLLCCQPEKSAPFGSRNYQPQFKNGPIPTHSRTRLQKGKSKKKLKMTSYIYNSFWFIQYQSFRYKILGTEWKKFR